MHVRLDAETLVLTLSREPGELAIVRSLPVRRFQSSTGAWLVPHVRENWDRLVAAGFGSTLALAGIQAPTKTAYQVDVHQGKYLAVRVPFSADNTDKCKKIPESRTWRGDPVSAWLCKPSRANVDYLRRVFPAAYWSDAATAMIAHMSAVGSMAPADKAAPLPRIDDYKFHSQRTPYEHQIRAFAAGRDRVSFAYFMEQGTGKTYVTINDVCYNAANNHVEAALVVCPNGVKDVWAEEIGSHAPEWTDHEVVVWRAGMKPGEVDRLYTALDKGKMPWLIMNVEAFSSDKGKAAAEGFLKRYRAMMIVDESTRIKTPGAKRTRAVVNAGKKAKRRRILSGTPVTQGPLDVFAPFKFLDPDLLGFGTYYAFRNHFAIMGGYDNREVVAYANLDELKSLVDPHSFRVLREECLDLPPKIYQRVDVDLTPEQKRAYKEMKDDMATELAGVKVSASIVLTKMLRLQQIAGGFVPVIGDDGEQKEAIPIPGPNPKINALLEVVEDLPGKVIVWCKFRAEISAVSRALRDAFGKGSVVEFHGGVKDEQRAINRAAFQDPDSKVRFFIGQTEAGGIGITLTEAKTVVYFSNSFSLESRLQSEDRAHRIGQTGSVTYVDLIAKGTIDVQVIAALKEKKSLADKITGDEWREWL
jgi:hypothetical protein